MSPVMLDVERIDGFTEHPHGPGVVLGASEALETPM